MKMRNFEGYRNSALIFSQSQVIDEVMLKYRDNKEIYECVEYLARLDIGAIPYFLDIFESLHDKSREDQLQDVPRVLQRFIHICETKSLDCSDIFLLCSNALRSFDKTEDISTILVPLEDFLSVCNVESRERVLSLVKYLNDDLIYEDSKVVNLLFPFIVKEMHLLAKYPDAFDSYVFAFQLLKVFAKHSRSNCEAESRTHCFLELFWGLVNRRDLYRKEIDLGAEKCVPSAIESLVFQGRDIDQSAKIVLSLYSEGVSGLQKFGEFLGFDPAIDMDYDPSDLVLVLIAKNINRSSKVRHLFSVARSRLKEMVCAELQFEQFAVSIFRNLLLFLTSVTCDNGIKAMQSVEAATNILCDTVVPLTFDAEDSAEGEDLLRILESIDSANPPKDEDVVDCIERYASARECIPVEIYDIVGNILLRLKELGYCESIDAFAEFYPCLREYPFCIKEAFIESIAYHMMWLHRSFSVILSLGDDTIRDAVVQSHANKSLLVEDLRRMLGGEK